MTAEHFARSMRFYLSIVMGRRRESHQVQQFNDCAIRRRFPSAMLLVRPSQHPGHVLAGEGRVGRGKVHRQTAHLCEFTNALSSNRRRLPIILSTPVLAP